LGAVLGQHPVLDHLELQGADRGQQGRLGLARADHQHLDHALLEQLLEAQAELLGVARLGVVQVGEDLGREAGISSNSMERSSVRVSPMRRTSWPTMPTTSPAEPSSTVSRVWPNNFWALDRRIF